MTTTTKAHELAEQMEAAMEVAKRDDGTEYYRLRDGSPEWMRDVCHAAHEDGADGGMLPDDERYRFIADALAILTAREDWEDADEDIEADVYTSDITNWLATRADRYSYVDEFVSEYGWPGDTIKALTGGQYMERQEVLRLVIDALEAADGQD